MEIIGYLSAIGIGLLIGLLGGGGSILTVPVLVYLFAVSPIMATTYSLFIVGVTSTIATVPNILNKTIAIKKALYFGVPSLIAVYATRAFIVPAMPKEVSIFGFISMSKDSFFMLFFALLMLASAYNMLRKKKVTEEECYNCPFSIAVMMFVGATEGFITGLVGAGGGFIIIPALVLIAKTPMKQAISTSLLIIGIKSIIGFVGTPNLHELDLTLLLTLTAIALVGMYFGIKINKKIDSNKLKPIFGGFVLIMGFFILIKELITFFN